MEAKNADENYSKIILLKQDCHYPENNIAPCKIHPILLYSYKCLTCKILLCEECYKKHQPYHIIWKFSTKIPSKQSMIIPNAFKNDNLLSEMVFIEYLEENGNIKIIDIIQKVQYEISIKNQVGQYVFDDCIVIGNNLIIRYRKENIEKGFIGFLNYKRAPKFEIHNLSDGKNYGRINFPSELIFWKMFGIKNKVMYLGNSNALYKICLSKKKISRIYEELADQFVPQYAIYEDRYILMFYYYNLDDLEYDSDDSNPAIINMQLEYTNVRFDFLILDILDEESKYFKYSSHDIKLKLGDNPNSYPLMTIGSNKTVLIFTKHGYLLEFDIESKKLKIISKSINIMKSSEVQTIINKGVIWLHSTYYQYFDIIKKQIFNAKFE